MSKGIFIVGTGTDVGKTYVSALIAEKIKNLGDSAAYYKAAMSGNVRGADGRLAAGDAEYVKRISGIVQRAETMCPYVYENAYSPHLAAKTEGDPVELYKVAAGYAALKNEYDYIITEGSGGIVCPLRYDEKRIFLADVIRALNLPCVIVADSGLGAINSVALTAEYMRSRGLKTKGIIFNRFISGDPICEDNVYMCEELTGLSAVAKIGLGETEFPRDPRKFFE